MSTFNRSLNKNYVQSFVYNKVEHRATGLLATVKRVSEELREIHQAYLLQCTENAQENKTVERKRK